MTRDGQLTRDELKARCVALAGCGDRQAMATLSLIEELDRLQGTAPPPPSPTKGPAPVAAEGECGRLHTELAAAQKTIGDFQYVLTRIQGVMTLAGSLLRLPDSEKPTEKRVPEKIRQMEHVIREARKVGMKTEPHGPVVSEWQPLPAVKSLPDGTDGDAERLKDLRQKMGLPETEDPAVTACGPVGPAGYYDKTQKMDKDGNKE